MITGVVTPYREGIIQLDVIGASGSADRLEAAIDTGFTGFLTLPKDLISNLGLPYVASIEAILGDGRGVELYMYEAVVIWNGRRCRVEVLGSDGAALVGMSLLYGFKLVMDVVEGGTITIEALH
jgi:clan AA aspartic protease